MFFLLTVALIGLIYWEYTTPGALQGLFKILKLKGKD